MASIKSHEDLVAWQLSDELEDRVYEIIARSSARKDRDFCNDIQRSGRSAPANLRPHTPFDMQTDLLVGVTRSFHDFEEALEEMKNARINAGIHFRTATEDGTALGSAVAQYVLEHKFQRIQ